MFSDGKECTRAVKPENFSGLTSYKGNLWAFFVNKKY
jgi:hypothetical protein